MINTILICGIICVFIGYTLVYIFNAFLDWRSNK